MKIKKGLDVPITGEPADQIEAGNSITKVALLGSDYVGMKPTMLVSEGDRVKEGQPIIEDKKQPGVLFTAPGAGTVSAINRGEKRVFLSLTIDLDGEEKESFHDYQGNVDSLTAEAAREQLIKSGLWTAFRTRPYSKTPAIDATPRSLFVNAMDTNPLAADPARLITESKDFFVTGLQVLSRLDAGSIHLCVAAGVDLPGADVPNVEVSEFSGPHPAGLVGTHIHFLDPVGPNRTVWHISYADVIAIGQLFHTGQVNNERVISLAGPRVLKPSLVRTRLGANLPELIQGQTEGDNNRVVSGSVLAGRTITEPLDYLGRFHQQVTVLEEGNAREFLGWQKPGFDKFSVTRIFASAFGSSEKRFDLTTSTGGSKREMVPVGSYEKVMPLDVEPTMLLRSLIVRDTEQSQLMGALELDEEDLALCTFVCPAKYDYGTILRDNLTQIEKEG